MESGNMHHGFTLWFTGLSGAGKSTLSRRVEEVLRSRGLRVEVFDGDEVRQNLSKGLGYSKEDRDTNIKRIGYVCNLLTRNGVAAITRAASMTAETPEPLSSAPGATPAPSVQCPSQSSKWLDIT